VVSDGCHIGRATIRKSVVGLRARIGNQTTIEESIVMGSDFFDSEGAAPWDRSKQQLPLGIGNYCHIRKAILDKNVRIGNDVKILNVNKLDSADGNFYYIREGIVLIPKNAVIPDGTVI